MMAFIKTKKSNCKICGEAEMAIAGQYRNLIHV